MRVSLSLYRKTIIINYQLEISNPFKIFKKIIIINAKNYFNITLTIVNSYSIYNYNILNHIRYIHKLKEIFMLFKTSIFI